LVNETNLFESVAPRGRLTDYVAEQIERLTVEGDLEPGTRLPSEVELCKQFNVSRTVVREAVNSLVAKGLVETRHGVGTTVRPFSREVIVSSLNRFLHAQAGGVSLQELHQVRAVLEMATARLAAIHATDADLVNLEEDLRAMEATVTDHEAFAARDADFHRLLAVATHNRLLVLLLDSIRDLMQDYIRSTLPHVDVGGAVILKHVRILERVRAKDPEGARQAMREHLTSAPWEQSLDPEVINF
jgi:GntR family transcriptional repressor for pyruvate dehydrogenase complex